MARLRVTNLKNIRSNIRKQIIKAARDPMIREGIGKIAVDDIKGTTYGTVYPNTPTYRSREYLERFNSMDAKYSRTKINITLTGELLADLQKNVKANTTGSQIVYVIEQSDKLHKKYKTGNTIKRKKKGRSPKKKYSTIANHIINDHNYDYLNFDDKTLKKMIELIRKRIFKILK